MLSALHKMYDKTCRLKPVQKWDTTGHYTNCMSLRSFAGQASVFPSISSHVSQLFSWQHPEVIVRPSTIALSCRGQAKFHACHHDELRDIDLATIIMGTSWNIYI